MTITRRAALASAVAIAAPVSGAHAVPAESPLARLGHELEAAMAADWAAWDHAAELSDRLDEWRWNNEGALAIRPEDVALGVPGAARAMEDKAAGRLGCFGKWDVAAMRAEQFTETIVERTEPAGVGASGEVITIRTFEVSVPELSSRCAEIVAAWDAREVEITASGLPERVEAANDAARVASKAVEDLIDEIAPHRARTAAEIEIKRRALIWAVDATVGPDLREGMLRRDTGEGGARLILSLIEDARALAG